MDGIKDQIRRRMLCRRSALSPLEIDAAERAVHEHLIALDGYRDAASVIAYSAVGGELATTRLIATALEDGKRVFLPRVAGREMTFAEHRAGSPLLVGRFGIPEPVGHEWDPDTDGPAVVFVPVVAFDAEGGRLGRGGGFYDRALARLRPDVRLIGLGYAFQQCAKIPRDPWDVSLDLVVGERGPVRRGNGGARPPFGKEDTTRNGEHTDGGGQHRAGRRAGAGAGLPAPAPG
jgi:5-formyltetrahydrofolate cyclo-ligase